MAITNAQQARATRIMKVRPMSKRPGYKGSRPHVELTVTPNEADKLVKLGGQETMTS